MSKDVLTVPEMIENRIAQPRRITLNLALPFADRQFDIGGTIIGIWDSPNANDTVQIRFNEVSADQIPMKRNKVIATPFNKIFITVPAGLVGNMEILYGAGTINYFRMYPNEAEGSVVMEQIRDELMGDLLPEDYGTDVIGLAAAQVYPASATRKGFDLQAGLGNAGNVYIGFDNGVLANNAAASLVAGQSYSRNDYRGPLFAIASAAGQLLNHSEV